MKLTSLLSSLVLFLSAVYTVAAPPPNVILIVSDDQGYNDIGCFGVQPVVTPNLDKLAAEGVRATNFYAGWVACTGSRSALLTGRYPQRNGLYETPRNDLVNYQHRYTEEEYAISPEMTLGLDTKELTIGDYLRTVGYTNGVVGKWGELGQAKRFLPLQRGFDFFYGHANGGIDYYTHERYGIHSMFRNNERTEEDRGTYSTDLFGREARNFVKEHAGKRPFFLYLPFNAPHGASTLKADNGGKSPGVQAPEEEIERYKDTVKDEAKRRYFAAVTRMDAQIGSVLDVVEEAGETENTIVIFLSDNGGSTRYEGNLPLRGGKSTTWEGGIRVPFIMRWPKEIPAGTVTDEFITILEILPMLIEVTGAEVPKDMILDGFNMLPVLQGKKSSERNEMFWQRRSDIGARVGHYKWVKMKNGGGLYDLRTDLSEEHDLSKEKPEVLKKVKARYAAWRKEMDECEPRGPFRDY